MSSRTFTKLIKHRTKDAELRKKKLKDLRKQSYQTEILRNKIRRALNALKYKYLY